MPDRVTFKVNGHPRPQPRPRVVKGRAISTADPLARIWIQAVERASASVGKVDKSWIRIELAFRFPTEDQARIYLPHTHVPDVDNLAKLVLDCLQRAGVIKNDSAVSNLTVRKSWSKPEDSGVTILIEEDPHREQLPDTPDWLAPRGRQDVQSKGSDPEVGPDVPRAS
jgi:Holliday junction resolvase RusA-like endonuclease